VASDAARCAGPAFPLVLANIYSSRTHAPLFQPYRILQRQISGTGRMARRYAALRIGIVGFRSPGPYCSGTSVRWKARSCRTHVREGGTAIYPADARASADLVIALAHGGLDGAPTAGMEDAGYYLARCPASMCC
jgi:2',3'-cyclic-nucleotide 2'-phosphodiesterase/3'-nucleotidase